MGNHENTDIGSFIAEYLDLDLEPITKELKKKNIEVGGLNAVETDEVDPTLKWAKWMGPVDLPEAEVDANTTPKIANHGDWRHRRRECEMCNA